MSKNLQDEINKLFVPAKKISTMNDLHQAVMGKIKTDGKTKIVRQVAKEIGLKRESVMHYLEYLLSIGAIAYDDERHKTCNRAIFYKAIH